MEDTLTAEDDVCSHEVNGGCPSLREQIEPPSGFLRLSEAKFLLWRSMFSNLPLTESVAGLRKQLRKQVGVRLKSGAQHEEAGIEIRNGASLGRLKIYAVFKNEHVPPELVPPEIVTAIVSSREALPDYPVRFNRLKDKSEDAFARKICALSLLVVNKSEFETWRAAERRKGRWPSQKGLKKRPHGRPKVDALWLDRIKALAADGGYIAANGVAALFRLLESHGQPPSEDTLARLLDGLFKETGDLRFKRPRRRPPLPAKTSFDK